MLINIFYIYIYLSSCQRFLLQKFFHSQVLGLTASAPPTKCEHNPLFLWEFSCSQLTSSYVSSDKIFDAVALVLSWIYAVIKGRRGVCVIYEHCASQLAQTVAHLHDLFSAAAAASLHTLIKRSQHFINCLKLAIKSVRATRSHLLLLLNLAGLMQQVSPM